jgi:2-polyprenyl-6-methoxyphenol hydroxylase-like FAD-dependent oxidoreductase
LVASLILLRGLQQSGHAVTVLERAPSIDEVGAGIQCAPNLYVEKVFGKIHMLNRSSTRVLARLGLLEEVMAYANVLDHVSLRRWQNDERLGRSRHAVGDFVFHPPLD